MKYRIVIQPTAEAEIEDAFRWIHNRSPIRAAKWFNGLTDAIQKLASHPEMYALAPETDAFQVEIRQLLYGKRGGVYRILFTLKGGTVFVLHARHGSRRLFEAGRQPPFELPE